MEAGVSYNKQRLHKIGYFRKLLAANRDIDDGATQQRSLGRDLRPGETKGNANRATGSSVARLESFCPLDKDLSWKSGYRNMDLHYAQAVLLHFKALAVARRLFDIK